MSLTSSPLAALQDPTLLKTQALINGQWVDAPQRFAVTDPATGAVLAEVPNLGAEQTQAAIAAANAAWPAWRALSAKARAAILMKWFHLLNQHADDLARIMTAEQGKPLAEARGEVLYGASFVEWFAEEARRVYGETIPSPDPSKRLLVLRQPVGVCAAITPWNFPVAMITRKVAPALAAGCPVVIKPAEATPLSALAVAELAQRAGMPPGVLNVITADAQRSIEVGKVLCASDTVRHLSFTGSTEVGRILMQQCAPTIKKLSLELGGNAPLIVFDDADLDVAVEGALASKYRNSGQTCVCANRMYVQAGIYDAFVARLAARVAEIKIGNGFEQGVAQGPLIDDEALNKVETLVADAVAKGAKVLTGGARAKVSGGAFYQATVLANVSSDMRVAREEIFGPVAPVFKFETEAEAIAAANHTEFGLASYFFSRDMGRIFRVGEALEYGMVGVNTGMISHCEAPFGGVKQSGLGREGARHGMDDYVEIKYLCLGGLTA
ncbi:MAG: succinate-semialdehyde dehydrogenase (NADP(+)) [Burkholderiales bacterium RIFCSPLOWO2_12_FULL_64_99]|uniref:NAD-dependent succinate-semialdehyde dehydrogenase n=1 Tax=Aquabacterium sp. TaxID=1872578 RepID=UPI0008B1FC1E|nr:NAD-dependent succinate-semialdehyde dehydrogenase [Aquabacterium sp.]OGB05153.1 MAG: succinate-semialdehyde dehydrogenase (NADP(+)) [Burkholderiales bacterium RIFCSPHIGHO2_12_FULL_63_20]OGB60734.1 MAG: succinate-semialdehyde dehydrogenase (NADP(+)) [Burkholderiales bacterium RIFCSPLOWO2_12_FULL_64_99]